MERSLRLPRPPGGAKLSINGGVVALAVPLLFNAAFTPNFLQLQTLFVNISQVATIAIVAIGMTLVIATGGIDLSVGSVAAFTSVVAAYLSPFGLQVAAPGAVAAGLAFGAVDAVFVVLMRIPPFIATLASKLGAKGGALVISGAQTIAVDWESNFIKLGMEKALNVLPWTIVIVIAIALALWLVLERTSIGRTVLAIGGSEDASLLMGLKVNRAKSFVYVLSGGCAGVAACFWNPASAPASRSMVWTGSFPPSHGWWSAARF